ncbi:alpha-1,2-fucosyltransferase [Paraflavisolibacter sp. H34]|uniref:alpha-1,2-fucosyltransferase n=1 Tax=Huijunlia imazamoxiresistens TaxID=3127457 RepID=UPI003015CFA7
MIVTKVYGGLAGQMIQYAVGKQISTKYGAPLYLDTSWFSYGAFHRPEFPREFKLDRFQVNYAQVDNSSLFWKLKLTSRFRKYNPFSLPVVKEKDHTRFDPGVLASGKKLVLDGYWNSFKYFEGIREELLQEFTPKEQPDERNRQVLEKIRNTNSVSIHFRRGDYKLTAFHGILSKEYYLKAIETVTKNLDNPQLFLFSDEPDWVFENMKFDLPYEVIDFNKNDKNYWDIELMRNCKHNIIANSGFSWWGAWLNRNPEKVVVAPKIWFAKGENPMNEFVPATWIRY